MNGFDEFSIIVSLWGAFECFVRYLIVIFFMQALEEELTQKKRDQENFFKIGEEADCQSPSSPNKVAKFFPFSSEPSWGRLEPIISSWTQEYKYMNKSLIYIF